MRRKSPSQRGASAVEFALVLPLLLLVLFGIIEFSVLFYNKAVITNASREGARQGIVFYANSAGNYTPLSNDGIKQVVLDYAQQYLITFSSSPSPLSTGDVTITRNPDPSERGGDLTVNVEYTYTYLVLPGLMNWGSTKKITAVTVMRME